MNEELIEDLRAATRRYQIEKKDTQDFDWWLIFGDALEIDTEENTENIKQIH